MRVRAVLLTLVAFVLATSIAVGQTDMDRELTPDPKVTIGHLENGLTYYIRENHKPEDRVELRLVVNAGSLLEDDDQQGLAHFLEHMAFNGTEHFQANELVAYLESIGARFGADLNAYTSFDQTVYMLEIPTDKEGLLEQGVLVLGDWAHTITMAPEEVEKERGVVLEEWRGGQGAQERLRRVHWPVLLAGSRYAERLPIGKPEIIEHASRERTLDFYKRWYRPDLMAVIAVGAFDAETMETLIRENFSSIPKVDNPETRPSYPVPSHDDMRASVATDEEMPYTQVAVYYKHPHEEYRTVRDHRRLLILGLMSSMLNDRLSEIVQKPDAPFKYAASGSGSSFRPIDMFRAIAYTDEGQAETALKALLTEIQRVKAHGFGASELERAKANLLAGMERAYLERDKTESSRLVAEYARNFLEGEPIPGIEVEYELAQELLPGISQQDLDATIARVIHENDVVLQASEPEKEGLNTAKSDALLAVAREVATTTPEPYEDEVVSGDLIPDAPAPGEVVSVREEAELGVTVLTLSNGVEVWIKPTDFKNDEILFSAQCNGGESLADENEYPSASIATDVVSEAGLGNFTPTDLEKKLSGKIVSVSPFIGSFTHGIRGSTTPRDFETALKLIYLTFTSPNPRPEAFEVLVDKYRLVIKNRLARPETRFYDRVTVLNHSEHYMFEPPTDEMLNKLDHDSALAFYRRVLADASDFRFFFVGTIDLESAEPLIARYIGALPSEPDTPPRFRDVGLRFPEGVTKTAVYAGTEPKSQTQMTWPALTGLDEFEMFYLRKANDILEIRLRDLLREELGGTYSVGVRSRIMGAYPGYGTTVISFGSSPENAEKLTQAVLDEIKKFRESGPTQEEVDKTKELELRALEKGMEQNGYWLASFSTLDLLGWDMSRILDRRERIESITIEKLQDTFSRYYPEDNFTVVTLLPEDQSPKTDNGSR